MTKLAILEEREEDKYEHVLSIRRYQNAAQDLVPVPIPVETLAATDPRVKVLVDSVMQSLSSARQSEVQAWEEELLPCEHTLTLSQFAEGDIPPSGMPHFLSPPAIWLNGRTQAWHIARNVTSRRTCGFALPAARLAAGATCTVAWAGTATRSRTLKRVGIQCASSWAPSRLKATPVSSLHTTRCHTRLTIGGQIYIAMRVTTHGLIPSSSYTLPILASTCRRRERRRSR